MAAVLKRIFNFFGFSREHHQASVATGENTINAEFTVKVPVPRNAGPVVWHCTYGAGGVQGLRWYAEKLMVDEDGDVAQEFFDEVVTEYGQHEGSSFKPKLEVKPAKLKGPLCTRNGNVHQSIHSSSG